MICCELCGDAYEEEDLVDCQDCGCLVCPACIDFSVDIPVCMSCFGGFEYDSMGWM